jgi:hypothetical protein
LARKSSFLDDFVVLDRGLEPRDVGVGTEFHDEVVDERDVVSKPEVRASISLPFVGARACLMRLRCLEILGLIETKKTFLTRSLECLGKAFFVLS